MDQVEPKFVRGELAGLPFECGLVELGYTADGATWSAVRLSSLGFEVLSRLRLTYQHRPFALGRILRWRAGGYPTQLPNPGNGRR